MHDWNQVTVLTKNNSRSNAKSKSAVNAAQRKGEEVETLKKRTAAQNKQHSVDKNTTKLSEETEDFHHERVPVDVSKLIQQARQEKGFTQKDLANKINEKPQIIAEYEQGKAIPNQAILTKMEKALGVKLRGKDKGHVLEAKAKK